MFQTRAVTKTIRNKCIFNFKFYAFDKHKGVSKLFFLIRSFDFSLFFGLRLNKKKSKLQGLEGAGLLFFNANRVFYVGAVISCFYENRIIYSNF